MRTKSINSIVKNRKAIHFTVAMALAVFFSTSCVNDDIVYIDGEAQLDNTGDDDYWLDENISLKNQADFDVGAAITLEQLQENDFKNTLTKEYSQITAEYEMKMNFIWTAPNSYDWEAVDGLVNFAEENNMDVHGHTLVWYSNFPEWFVQAEYDSVAFENHVKNYITDVVTRYKGRIKSWDVVNEVFADEGGFRDENVILPVFNDPIAFYGRCFQYAHEADPDALLFYNDYNLALESNKRSSLMQMTNRFAQENIPIDGIGDQFHHMQSTDKETLENGFHELSTTGLLMHLSELDIRMNVNQSDTYIFNNREQEKQRETYRFVTSMYNSLPDNQKYAISTWGVTDKYTWLTGYWHEREYPLLFDRNYKRKKAYAGFLEGLE